MSCLSTVLCFAFLDFWFFKSSRIKWVHIARLFDTYYEQTLVKIFFLSCKTFFFSWTLAWWVYSFTRAWLSACFTYEREGTIPSLMVFVTDWIACYPLVQKGGEETAVALMKIRTCFRYRDGNVNGDQWLVRTPAIWEMFCRKHWTFKSRIRA